MIFEFEDYRKYLASWLKKRPKAGHGEVTRLAGAARCHVTYFSQVMHGKSELSLEQAELLNAPLGHDEMEAEYFLLLVQKKRAGTASLEAYFQRKLHRLKTDFLNLKNRITVEDTLSNESKMKYYSAWYFAAIHIATSIPELQTKDTLAKSLGLSPILVSQVLSFLEQAGLVARRNSIFEFRIGKLHLPSDSPLVNNNHTNWRMIAIQSLNRNNMDNLHYSSVVSLALNDVPKAKMILIDAIEKVRALVRDSKEETVYCYLLDLFDVAKPG